MSYTRVTKDDVITPYDANLHGVVLLASAAGGDASIYKGGEGTAGELIDTFKGAQNTSLPVMFDPPIECIGGIFVDVGSNITSVLVLWTPRRD